MRLPKSFNEITVGQYQEVYFLIKENPKDDWQLAENWCRVISILSGEDYEKVTSLPRIELKGLIRRLDFILRPEVLLERTKKYIYANGVFKANLRAEQISTAQAFDIKALLNPVQDLSIEETTILNGHKLLASIYLPLTWRGFKYGDHAENAEKLKGAKMGDVYGTLFFYSVLYENLMRSILESTESAVKTLQEHYKEVEKWMQENALDPSGDGKLQSTN